MNTQEQQIGFIKEIAELKESNPNHEIHFMTDTTGWDEDYGFYGGEIISVKLGKWLVDAERIFVDEDDLREHYEEYLLETEEGAQKMVDKMKPAILVRIAG